MTRNGSSAQETVQNHKSFILSSKKFQHARSASARHPKIQTANSSTIGARVQRAYFHI
jgi:hypothetical protein